MKKNLPYGFCITMFLLSTCFALDAQVLDRWQRDVTTHGILLLDWEGYIGNPEPRYTIEPPLDMKFPVTMTITVPNAPEVYLYGPWDFPRERSMHSIDGPEFTFVFNFSRDLFNFRIGVNPDRDYDDDVYMMHILFFDGTDSLTVETPIQVIDQDYDRPSEFNFTLDISADTIYNFYRDNPEAAPLMQQIMDDVAYYLTDQGADPVPAGSNTTHLYFAGEDGSSENVFVTNKESYTGSYMYSTSWSHGSNPNDIWSTGSSSSGFLTSNGNRLNIYAGGNVRPHPIGDRSAVNTTGWNYNIKDDEWWTTGMPLFGESPTGCPSGEAECNYYHVSFYSVMKHELMHAVGYNTTFPKWRAYADSPQFCINDEDLMSYTGRCSPLQDRVHAWDPVLHRREWNQGVELIDKFELLVMQAVGWELRETTPFIGLDIATDGLENGRLNEEYFDIVEVTGGVPNYHFSISSGSLPPGLIIDSFTGEISGTPTSDGAYSFTILVEDNDVDNNIKSNGQFRNLEITIGTTSSVDVGVVSNNFNLHPNPSSGNIYLEVKELNVEDLDIDIYNSQGQFIRKMDKSKNRLIEIQRNDLIAGQYYIRIHKNGSLYHIESFILTD